MPFRLRDQTLLLGRSKSFDPLTIDFGRLQHGRNQFFLAPINFRLLHLDLLLLLDLLHLHLLSNHLLLHDVGLDVISLVGLRLLTLGDFEVLRFLDLQVALRFRLLAQRQRFRQHALLIGLGLGYCRFPLRQRALDRRIAVGFCRGNVGVALEVMPNALSSASSICDLIEEQLEGLNVGICLDYGHANLTGDLSDAIETVGGHLWTTHVHDNDGRKDDHRVPFAGRIDWDLAIMETQKIGYDDVLMFEVADTGDPIEVLGRTVKARERLEHMFVAF